MDQQSKSDADPLENETNTGTENNAILWNHQQVSQRYQSNPLLHVMPTPQPHHSHPSYSLQNMQQQYQPNIPYSNHFNQYSLQNMHQPSLHAVQLTHQSSQPGGYTDPYPNTRNIAETYNRRHHDHINDEQVSTKRPKSTNEHGFQDSIKKKNTTFTLIGSELIAAESSCNPHTAITKHDKEQMKQYLYNHCGKQEVAILETQAAGSRPPVLSPHYVETPKALVYFYCRFQQHSCKMRYLVMRFKSYFAFYTSQGSHTHQVQKIQLPTKIRQMIYDLYTQANVVRTIMIALDKKNDAGLKDIFGAENMDVLKKVEKRNKLEKMIKSRVDYLKSVSATSRTSGRPRRTIQDAVNTIQESSINIKQLIEDYGTLTVEQVLAILPGDKEDDYGCYYTKSDLGDENSGDYTSVQWITKQAFRTAADMIKMCEESGLSIMAQYDYTHSKLNDGGIVGIVGMADLYRQFHASSMDYNKSEKAEGAMYMLEATILILTLMGYKKSIHGPIYIIMDGSNSLRSACKKLGCIPRRCTVHIFRIPDKKKGMKGYSGTGGSIYVFFNTHGIPDGIAYIIRVVMYTFLFFPDERTYVKGREIFMYNFDHGSFYGLSTEKRALIRHHLFEFYLNEVPEWGFSGTEPGHVKSTNG